MITYWNEDTNFGLHRNVYFILLFGSIGLNYLVYFILVHILFVTYLCITDLNKLLKVPNDQSLY